MIRDISTFCRLAAEYVEKTCLDNRVVDLAIMETKESNRTYKKRYKICIGDTFGCSDYTVITIHYETTLPGYPWVQFRVNPIFEKIQAKEITEQEGYEEAALLAEKCIEYLHQSMIRYSRMEVLVSEDFRKKHPKEIEEERFKNEFDEIDYAEKELGIKSCYELKEEPCGYWNRFSQNLLFSSSVGR